ncbi:MAG: hypothetical protein N2053_07050 [Chitinispirillaceae bacterium]|nr:hypothetical protein [Chitinispirillaceae bacterium]
MNEFHRETVNIIGRNSKGVGATLSSLKKEADVLFLTGRSKIIIDGCYFNPEHCLDIKTPFNICSFSPESKEVKRLSLYLGRIQEITKNIHWNRQVAILNPTLELMSFYTPTEEGADTYRLIYEKFERLIFALERNGVSYDLVNPSFLLNCTIRNNGEFGPGGEKTKKNPYQALIVPYLPEISREALAFIEKLVQKQGKVIFIDEPPKGTIEDGVSLNMCSRMEKIMSKRYSGTAIIKFEELDEFLKTISTPVSIIVNGNKKSEIFQTSGYGENYELYLFHNFSDKEEIATIELPQNRHFTFVDCENGEMVEVVPSERKGNICSFKVTMQGGATVILVGSSAQIVSPSTNLSSVNISVNPFSLSERNYRIVLKDLWLFTPCSLNALPLSVWNKRIGLSRESGGFSHYYESSFQVNVLPSIASLFFSSYGTRRNKLQKTEPPVEITVNGVKIEPASTFPEAVSENITNEKIWDDSIITSIGRSGFLCNIKEHLVEGMNRISIRTKGDFLDPDTFEYPPIIFGDFKLIKGKTGWVIDKLGEIENRLSWTLFGFPYLCGKGKYYQSFEIPNEHKRLILRLPFVSGTVSIYINQKEVGTFCFQPIEIDVTSFCEDRRNDIDIFVVNSVDTLLRMNGRQSGIIGDIYLDVY